MGCSCPFFNKWETNPHNWTGHASRRDTPQGWSNQRGARCSAAGPASGTLTNVRAEREIHRISRSWFAVLGIAFCAPLTLCVVEFDGRLLALHPHHSGIIENRIPTHTSLPRTRYHQIPPSPTPGRSRPPFLSIVDLKAPPAWSDFLGFSARFASENSTDRADVMARLKLGQTNMAARELTRIHTFENRRLGSLSFINRYLSLSSI